VVISGPLLGSLMAKWVPHEAPADFLGQSPAEGVKRPGFGMSLTVILLPVVLMLAATVVQMAGIAKSPFGAAVGFVGTPLIALAITTVLAMFVFGYRLGNSLSEVGKLVGQAFAPIAGILFIVGAGGGFKQTLVDSKIADMLAQALVQAALPTLLAAWLVAVAIRLATGSATVATITASGIMAPLAAGLSPTHTALMVLAIGAGSVFLSHVNDAGFWMVKEYFGLTVGETFKTWSLMETVLSVVGLASVMLLSVVV
jgi:GntP family gluconate:H+ symporter